MTRNIWCRWRIGGGYLLCALVVASVAGCIGNGSSPASTAAGSASAAASGTGTDTGSGTGTGSGGTGTGATLSLSGSPATQIKVGQTYSFTPSTAPATAQALQYSIQNKPAWATFSSTTGQLSGTPSGADVGTDAGILISGSSGTASASLPTFSIAVLPSSTLDAYGGVATVNCTNPNGTKYFGLATVASHKVLCDAAGHPYFGRGFFVFDFSSLGNDEKGGNYNSYIQAKFGTTGYEYKWDDEEVARMKSWGFNMIGPYATAYALASWPWTGGGTNPNKVPFIVTDDACAYSWSNRSGWGTAPVKDLLSVASPNWKGTGYYGYGGVTDYEDPAWVNYVDGMISTSGDGTVANVINANATDKSYLIGVIGCDSDDTHGFGAGPDFETSPSVGNADFRLSYEVALSSPVEWASTHQHQIYNDSTVYSKETWYTQLTGQYASISALNAAWGSSYTTFGTSGTCYGSHFGTWICASPSAPSSVGTGNGSTLSFSATLNTTVSANSVGIFVAGTLVGGDGGDGLFSGTSGIIYGPNFSGTINYATGALSIAFTSGHAPANGAAITAEYIANGWGIGSGVMDEDGRSSHVSWVGNNSVCIDGAGNPANCHAGAGTAYASSGMVSDLNTLDTTLASQYAKTYKHAIDAKLPGALFLGGNVCSTWGVPPNRYVLAGLASNSDLCLIAEAAGGTVSGLTQAELDFIHTYAGDLAIGDATYNTANLDSPFAWPNSSCTHSAQTVTCTIATPQNLSTGWAIMTRCTDSSYNVNTVRPSFVSGTSLSYTATSTPANASTTCDIAFDDSEQSDFATQADRAAAVASQLQSLTSAKYTADGIDPYVMAVWWQWSDKQDEYLDWGLVDTRDNAYGGLETTTSAKGCQAPLQAYSCGGELRGGWGSSDGITPLINANAAIDKALATLP